MKNGGAPATPCADWPDYRLHRSSQLAFRTQSIFHFFTRRCTLLARERTGFAVGIVVLFAFRGAGKTDFPAVRTRLGFKGRCRLHQCQTRKARMVATFTKRHTFFALPDRRAVLRAGFAGFGAGPTRRHAGHASGRLHGNILSERGRRRQIRHGNGEQPCHTNHCHNTTFDRKAF